MNERAQYLYVERLSVLLKAGATPQRAASLLAAKTGDEKSRASYSAIADRLSTGATLGDAIKASPEAFSPAVADAVATAASTSDAPNAIGMVADYLRKKSYKKSALEANELYYLILLVIATIIATYFSRYFAVQINFLFRDLGGRPPAFSNFMLELNDFLYPIWPILAIMMILIIVLRFALPEKWNLIIAKLPPTKSVRLRLSVLYLESVAILLKLGRPLGEALEKSIDMIDNRSMRKDLQSVLPLLKEGKSIGDILGKNKVMPTSVTDIISLGEESAGLDASIIGAAEAGKKLMAPGDLEAFTVVIVLCLVSMSTYIAAMLIALYLPLFTIVAL